MKIYTKTGDGGSTSLIGGKRVLKSDLRLEAYGSLDELNAHLALLREMTQSEGLKEHIVDIQKHLFRIGALLATPAGTEHPRLLDNLRKVGEITTEKLQELETEIDLIEASLPEMTCFVIPGGNLRSAQCHVCRTVCRRCERLCVALNQTDPIDNRVIQYLNRLSDYLFVLSRKMCLCDSESEELYWDGI